MCLGIPMTVVEVEGFLMARCTAEGVERRVSLMLLHGDEVGVGDHVLVHLGNAVRRLTQEEFDQTWEVLRSPESMAPPPSDGPGRR
jgi:hydrogenase expression/formation protein HypC